METICAILVALSLPLSAYALPTVDLGYAVHQAALNATGNYYSFSNIRYGEPPVGELRFAKSIPPRTINRVVNNGSIDRICPQAYPDWLLKPQAEARGIPLAVLQAYIYSDVRQSEDCLMLDVKVPTTIWDNRKRANAPVLVWIHGGGYTLGSKTDSGNPAGLISRAEDGGNGVIYVSINYRLGMFGWMVGPNVVSNAALFDQNLALEWIQKYISLFGGDCSKVTVLGESAGGGSIMHQITAFGRDRPAPFARAIIQSPAWALTLDEAGTWAKVLSTASSVSLSTVSTASGLRSLTSPQLFVVNQQVVGQSSLISFSFGPSASGLFTPETVPQLLAKGRFAHNVEVMPAHSLNETNLFIPSSANASDLAAARQVILFGASAAQVSYVESVLYPEVYDGTYGYWSPYGRTALMISDAQFTCNTWYLAKAFNNATYNYLFASPPGYHGQDLAYTFYNNGNEVDILGIPVVASLAHAMQDYYAAFAARGDPNAATSLPSWPQYGLQGSINVFGPTGVVTALDDKNTTRCSYWQSGAWRATR